MFPQYFLELEGMADGAGVPFHILFLVNLAEEIESIIPFSNKRFKETGGSTACTDIMVLTPNVHMIGHNEDNEPVVKRYSFMVNVTIVDKFNNILTHFTAYNYPGYLAGNAWGFNSQVVFSTNAVSPRNLTLGGIARNFINRNIYESSSIDDAIKRIAQISNRASGFSLNIGQIGTKTIANIEVGPNSYSVKYVNESYYHFNMYRHLNISQYDDPSTDHRQARADQLPIPANETGIFCILGDTEDKEYPIYRDAAPPDCCSTVSTALFDLDNRRMSMYLSNPKLTSNDPVLVLPF